MRLPELWRSGWKKWRALWLGYANRGEICAVRRELEAALRKWPAPRSVAQKTLSGEERGLCEQILAATREHNRNNVTRTAAYLDYFLEKPDIHWAFLAHMVSRNGGYQMTDLKGDLLSGLLEPGEAGAFFQFLERANYLIFGDAYPQLLLYAASRDAGRPLFHLLPALGVSRFMRVCWERYWTTRDAQLLTMALVVNEQNFIEHRVVQHPDYQKVVESFEFQAQTFLNLTQVLFPYHPASKNPKESRLPLAGVQVDTFVPLSERIDTGRRLYAILFKNQEVYAGALRWARETPHTGSRADYWPEIFDQKKKEGLTKRDHPRLVGCNLRCKEEAIYSPRLVESWPDVRDPAPAGGQDWCVDSAAAAELYGKNPPDAPDISRRYCQTLALLDHARAFKTWWDSGRE
jgi:hypothetical protein